MKINPRATQYLLKEIVSSVKKDNVIKEVFSDRGLERIRRGTFNLEAEVILKPIFKELQRIASEIDGEYKITIDEYEGWDIILSLPEGAINIRLPGDQEPYAESAEEDGEYYFDIIGDYEINIYTNEVEFTVEKET